ncbi:unnamed protein product [Arctia plantaginis]|uniref:PHD-type domain-containing protein n=1 Tax=Arctia plantaginis TaxID=874455 RepID=A0A8S1A4L4_ARCPL|nr:unnamed protein product [Arctia plantaginis]
MNKLFVTDSSCLWGCCTQGAKDEPHLKCSICNKAFHYVCLSVSEDSISPLEWKCPACTPKSSKKDQTPIRNVSTTRGSKRPALNSPPQVSSDKKFNEDTIRKIIEDTIANELKKMLSILNTTITDSVNKEIKPVKDEITQISESLIFLNNSYEHIVREHEDSKKKIKDLLQENQSLKAAVIDLTSRTNQLEQQARSCNLELQCVPEKKNENLYRIVANLGQVVGCDIKVEEIHNCTRIAKLNRASTRPRSIVVQLGSPRIRDQLLASTIKYNKTNPENKLNSVHLGIPGIKHPVYVLEHLSAANKSLHAAARLKAKHNGYKYVWVRNGRIFMRKSDETEYIIVKNIAVLDSLS